MKKLTNKISVVKPIKDERPELRDEVINPIIIDKEVEKLPDIIEPIISKELESKPVQENSDTTENAITEEINNEVIDDNEVVDDDVSDEIVEETTKVKNKRPSRGKKALVETLGTILADYTAIENALKEANKKAVLLKKKLIEYRKDLKVLKVR